MKPLTLTIIFLTGLLQLPVCTSAAPPHTFNEGVALFEAEDYSTNVSPRSSHQWVITNTVPDFSGAGYAAGTPDNGLIFSNWSVTSPELQYQVIFNNPTTHYVWVRAYGTSGSDNSVHWGLDGVTNAAPGINWSTFNSWVWTNGVSASMVATVTPASVGTHNFNLWIREDGALVDRVVITTNINFQPRIGNSWHIPGNLEPGIPSMRLPFGAIYSNTAVTIFSGNQFQGGVNGANQLQVGSAIFYRNATNTVWTEIPLIFHSESGNNKYFSNVIPANVFSAGDLVQYYLRIAYSDRLTAYLYSSNSYDREETEIESVAQSSPFEYRVHAQPNPGFPSPADWRDMSIYMLFTDRFYDGDPSNNDLHPEEDARPTLSQGIHGGDFKGLETKLDYIKGLGATAIWITPVFLTANTNTAYHGYTAQDFYQISPTWGGLPALTNMVAAAHARGLRVILDIVCNHQGTRIDSADQAWTNTFSLSGYTPRWTTTNMYPQPFNQLTNFHNNGHIQNFDDDTQGELGELRGLDDLRTETPYVRTNMLQIYTYWLDQLDVDAFRLDAVKHTDMKFWQLFNPEMRAFAAAKGKTNFFQFGESVAGDAKNGTYTGYQSGPAFANDSILDFGLFFSMGNNNPNNNLFMNSLATAPIEDHYNAIPANFDPAAQDRLVTFLDNHDRSRIMSYNGANTNKLKVGLTFLYTARGIPCLYYGTEQNFNGNVLGTGIPSTNREDMFDGQFEKGPSLGDNFDMTKDTYQHVGKLNNFRRLYPSLLRGTHVNQWKTSGGGGLFAYQRRLGGEEVLVVFNNSGTSRSLTNRTTIYTAGTQLVNLFDTNEIVAVTASTNTPVITVPGNSAKMFIAQSLLKPLDPIVISQTPAHSLTNVPPNNPLVLRFSKPMNTNSVQSALVVNPPVGGAFSWSADREIMTFTPAGAGFSALATNVIRIETNAMDSVSSNFLYAPFETFFVTSASSSTDTVPPSVTILQPTNGLVVGGPLLIAGTATDNVSVSSVEFRLEDTEWVAASGTTAWAYGLNSTLFLNGTRQISARATDWFGNQSTETVVNVRFFNVPGAFEQRISAGNPGDATNCDASVWAADRAYSFGNFGYLGGTDGNSANIITGVCAGAQSLYQRQRFSTDASGFSYWFHCPPGVYQTLLVETETEATGATQRLFDVQIENEPVSTSLDLYAVSGGINLPLLLTFTGAVPDGLLELQVVPQAGNARISGIQIRKIGEVDTDADGVPDWWMLGHFDHATGEDADNSKWDQNYDNDDFNNAEEYVADTLPTNPASFFHILDFSLTNNPTVVFTSSAYRVYSLQGVSQIPETGSWSNLQQDLPGTGQAMTLVDTNPPGQQIYRLQVAVPAP